MIETAVAISVITGVIQALKIAGLPSRFAPLLAIAFGIAFSAFANTVFNFQTVLFGIITGLSSMGLYDGVKVGTSEGKTLVGKILEK